MIEDWMNCLVVGDRLVDDESKEPYVVQWFFGCGTAYIVQRHTPCQYHSVHPNEMADYRYKMLVTEVETTPPIDQD